MSALRIALVAVLLLCGTSRAQYAIPAAQVGVHNSDGTPLLKGCGVVFDGGTTAGLLNVRHPAGADTRPFVIVGADIAAGGNGGGYYVGLTPIQVRLAATVAAERPLRVADGSGAFEQAPYGSTHAVLWTITGGAAGTSTAWAVPIASRSALIANPAYATATGATGSPTRSSATPAVLAEMSAAVTTSGGLLVCDFTGSFELQPGDAGFLALFVDGGEVAGTRRTLSNGLTLLGLGGSVVVPVGLHAQGAVSAAAHTATVQWAATAGTLRASGVQRRLDCEERAR